MVSFLLALLALLGLGTIGGFFGPVWWPLELASHFRIQYAWALVLVSAGLFPSRRSPAVIGVLLALLNLSMMVPFYRRQPPRPAGRVIRAVLLNLQASNTAYDRAIDFLRSSGADVIVVVEVNQRWLTHLEALSPQYPYRKHLLFREYFGIMLLSRMPFERAEIIHVGAANLPSVVARFNIDGQPFTFIGTHPIAPMRPLHAYLRDHQLRELAVFAGAQTDPVVLMGDLNTTSWSRTFQSLLRVGRLRDSRVGFGLQPSWPAWLPAPLRIPIDHCLVTDGVVVRARRLGPLVGSDHRPVIVDLALAGSPGR